MKIPSIRGRGVCRFGRSTFGSGFFHPTLLTQELLYATVHSHQRTAMKFFAADLPVDVSDLLGDFLVTESIHGGIDIPRLGLAIAVLSKPDV